MGKQMRVGMDNDIIKFFPANTGKIFLLYLYKIYMDFEPHADGIICNISVAPTASAINYGKKMEKCTALLDQTIAAIGILIKEKHKESTAQDS